MPENNVKLYLNTFRYAVWTQYGRFQDKICKKGKGELL